MLESSVSSISKIKDSSACSLLSISFKLSKSILFSDGGIKILLLGLLQYKSDKVGEGVFSLIPKLLSSPCLSGRSVK